MKEPVWLEKAQVLEMHDAALQFGGASGVRDETLLESALAKPENLYAYENPTIFEMAASYAEGIAQNHPFVDGNKRTSLYAADVFLQSNGYELNADQQELQDKMVDLAEKKITREDMGKFFEENSREYSKDQTDSSGGLQWNDSDKSPTQGQDATESGGLSWNDAGGKSHDHDR
jgi:death on curing protein